MLNRSSLAAVNNLLHAVSLSAVLVVSTLGLTEELSSVSGEDVLTVAAAAVTGASVAYGATLEYPASSVGASR